MPRNSMKDLTNLLFEQLENIITAESPEDIEVQVKKGEAASKVADQIIKVADVQLKAAKIQCEYGRGDTIVPKMLLEHKNGND